MKASLHQVEGAPGIRLILVSYEEGEAWLNLDDVLGTVNFDLSGCVVVDACFDYHMVPICPGYENIDQYLVVPENVFTSIAEVSAKAFAQAGSSAMPDKTNPTPMEIEGGHLTSG